jgi:nitrite reductase/ring-hydroxylating ferredoxin subunit
MEGSKVTEPPPLSTVSPCLSRRALLAALGATSLATALAACSSDVPDPDPAGDSPGPATGAASPASPRPSASRQVLGTTAAVPVGGGAILGGVLVVQPSAGQFQGFDPRCPHMGARLSPPQAGVITCYEHNSTFRDTDGSRLAGPAPRGLRRIPLAVDGTTITTA